MNTNKIKGAVLFLILFLTGILVSCVNTNYIEKNHESNIKKLKACQPYTNQPVSFEFKNLINQEEAAQIREFFKSNTELDLEALAASSKTTWEKSLELACFVAKNIPHDNQKEPIDERSAIPLWEYSRRVKTGFNCRWHSILLSELMLAAGIKNCFVTCLPEDKNDSDCHVVNLVWLPELNKWAMIDSDMMEYVTDSNGTPLSLEEMRECIIKAQTININVLPGFENSWVAKKDGIKYMHSYWAKNLYWFCAHTTYGFGLEGKMTLPDSYIALVPPGYDCSGNAINEVTTNAAAFWDR
ncbi:MAG: transglutaminase-like domain-containing protein [Treponema sp.]|nr:transglutaminase-like domain-containing protein [Treponema sp.]